MSDPSALTPSDFHILAERELRKAGLRLDRLTVRDRRALSDDRAVGEYALVLDGELRVGEATRRLLVECRREARPCAAAAVRAIAERRGAAKADHAVIFATAGFDAGAAREARGLGVALLAVADGRAAFARSPWSSGGPPPAWVPEFMSEVVELGPAGELRQTLVVADQPGLILERFVAD